MNEVADDHIAHDLRKANMRPYMTGEVPAVQGQMNGGLHDEQLSSYCFR